LNNNVNNNDSSLDRLNNCRKVLMRITTVVMLTLLWSPLTGDWLMSPAAAQQADAEQQNERSNFWRAVREGNTGYTAVQGQETNVLIQPDGVNELGIPIGGENWRALRNGPVATYGAWIFAGVIALIVIVFILFGRMKLENGRAGYTVERWGMFDRTLHWFTAISFIVLTLTGLSLLYGGSLLIPHIGKDAFAVYASFAKELHNYLGPFFAVSLILQLLKWMKYNFPTFTDIAWFFKGGGLIGSIHPSAGRMNGGEKVWYWILFIGGAILIGSGFVLDFPGQIPWYGQTREEMQVAHLLHVGSAIILIAVALGHIYIGTIGSEGSLEGMTTGRVDTAWAKQHHDRWYEQLMEEGVQPEKTPDVPVPADQAKPHPT
jgi:formate dehydrogenase subunit gamma